MFRNKQSNKADRGFTLIELIIIIAILGILAVVAAPKFLDIKRDARIAALKGIAGSLKHVVDQVQIEANLQGRTGEQGYLLDIDGVIIRTYFDAARETWQGQSGATGLQGLLLGDFNFVGRAVQSNAALRDLECTGAEFCVIDLTITNTIVPGKPGYGIFFFPQGTKLADNCFAYYAFSTDTPGQPGATRIDYRETTSVDTGC